MAAAITDLLAFAAELCLYISAFGFIASRAGSINSGIVYFGASFVTGAACYILQKRKLWLRLLPLPLLFMMFWGASGAAGIALPLPIILYIVLRTVMRRWSVAHGRVKSMLKFGLIGYAVILLIAAVGGSIPELGKSSLPFFTAFLILCVTDMKLLRTTELAAFGPRYYILTSLVVLLIGALGFVMSSEAVSSALFAGIKFVYDYVIAPLLLVAGVLLAAIPSIIILGAFKLISMATGGVDTEEYEIAETDYGDELYELAQRTVTPEWAQRLGVALGIAAVTAAVVVIVIKLVKRTQATAVREDNTAAGERDAAAPMQRAQKKRAASLSDSSVRAIYRRYLLLMESIGIGVGNDASDKLCERSAERFGPEQPSILREVWLPARYSEGGGGRENVRAARKAYQAMRGMSRRIDRTPSRKPKKN